MKRKWTPTITPNWIDWTSEKWNYWKRWSAWHTDQGTLRCHTHLASHDEFKACAHSNPWVVFDQQNDLNRTNKALHWLHMKIEVHCWISDQISSFCYKAPFLHPKSDNTNLNNDESIYFYCMIRQSKCYVSCPHHHRPYSNQLFTFLSLKVEKFIQKTK